MMISLNIQILPFGDTADLVVNGRTYRITPQNIHSPEDLQRLLSGEQPWVYTTVMSMLQAAAQ